MRFVSVSFFLVPFRFAVVLEKISSPKDNVRDNFTAFLGLGYRTLVQYVDAARLPVPFRFALIPGDDLLGNWHLLRASLFFRHGVLNEADDGHENGSANAATGDVA